MTGIVKYDFNGFKGAHSHTVRLQSHDFPFTHIGLSLDVWSLYLNFRLD